MVPGASPGERRGSEALIPVASLPRPMADDSTSTSVSTVAAALRDLGLAAGDVVLVHSALSGLDCRPEDLLAAIREVLGPEGTLVVPTFTPSFRHESPDGVFDLRETPSTTGYFTELVRQHPDSTRNVDPTHSFAALGARAEELGRLHARNTYDRNNVLGRLHDLDARLLTVGLDPFGRSVTFFHYVEQREGVERAGWRYRHEKAFSGTVVVNGKAFDAEYAIHVQDFERGVVYDFAPIGEALDERGLVEAAAFAGKEFRLMSADEIYGAVRDVIVETPERVYSVGGD